MISKISAMAAIIALAGCVSDQEMNARPPSTLYESQRTVVALEECLAQSFAWAGRATVIHGDGRTIIDYGNITPILTFTIYDKGDHRVVEERHPHRALAPDWRRHIEACTGVKGERIQ